ncbi:MAG: nodulation protein NfeD [Anaerolineales bacterium]|nr:nodulation protein NfeD [Anaerolineales bacterium]MDW8446056.1 nodulation protein NfeD [Anaerolineales bacterium]
MRRFLWLVVWLIWLAYVVQTGVVFAQANLPLIYVLTAEGPVTPAMREYLRRGIQIAERRNALALIFQLNTPGGSVDTTTTMIQDIRESRVPVVVYVQPRGAMAGSAGTLITLAGHIAAMAPETTIGAASPVGAEGQELGQTMEAKVKNMLKATVRSLAERRGEEAVRLAEETIESATAVSANEALQAGLIDFVADDLVDLIRQMDGFTVQMADGPRTLQTTGAMTERIAPSLIEQVLSILTNPNIVFLLLTIGVQAIIIELYSPGGWVAGLIGVVCVALALYGLGVLPVNWFGLVFIIIAFILFVLELNTPTFGGLTVAGIISLIVGALVLFNSPGVPSFQRVSVPLVILTSSALGILFVGVLLFALRTQRTPIRMGIESVIGKQGEVKAEINPVGSVQVGGELWTAELQPGQKPIPVGSRVEVIGKQGIRLYVKEVDEPPREMG